MDETIEEGDEDAAEEEEGQVDGEEKEAPEPAEPEEEASAAPKKKLTNQFNFCERAALTYSNPSRVCLNF